MQKKIDTIKLGNVLSSEYENYLLMRIRAAHDGIRIKLPKKLTLRERNYFMGWMLGIFYRGLAIGIIRRKELSITLTRNTIEIREVDATAT